MIPGFVEAETSDRVAQKMSSNSSLEDIRRKLEEETLENERLRRKNIELYDRLRSEQERYRRDLDIATTEVQRTRKQLTHDREKTKKLETQLEQSQSMLRTRSDELRNVQDILAITDEPSDSEILHLIQDINAATYQCSAQLAEGWPFTLKKTARDADDVVLRMVGKGMINVLQSGPHEEQQVLTQIAIQAFFAASVTWMISAWTFHSETLLAELYNTLHKNGEFLESC